MPPAYNLGVAPPGLHAQNLLTVLGSNMEHNCRDLYDHLTRKTIFSLVVNKIIHTCSIYYEGNGYGQKKRIRLPPFTTLMIPKLVHATIQRYAICIATMSYPRVQLSFTNESSICCSNTIKHKQLSLLNKPSTLNK